MQWPVSRIVHPDAAFLELLQLTIAEIANTIVEFEPVVMLMGDAHIRQRGGNCRKKWRSGIFGPRISGHGIPVRYSSRVRLAIRL